MPPQDFNETGQYGKRRNFEQPGSGATEKRRRVDNDYTFTSAVREADSARPKKQLSHADYTVAWICALPLELKAARLMLDEEHMPLPVTSSDDNVYTLGSIAGHNVAITSLRAGVYGLISATAVGKDMISTFPNITSFPLLVGIGGGVPSSANDIRLGDVVVSKPTSELPAVRQYDCGKTGLNGQLEIRGFNNKPAPALLNAVASLQARYDPIGRRIQDHISKGSQKYGVDIQYPGTDLDTLHEPECEHILDDSVCNICGPLKPVEREPRSSSDPELHFGPIASGSQVIKHARTRNRLAEAHGFLCFEMEAAGLMDFLPCLVIRGISDYCDSFKHKQFQQYAALTAAAFAKELLLVLPKKKIEAEFINESSNAQKLKHRRLVMETLDFIESDNRRATITRVHSKTCQWLFSQQEYTNWRHAKVTKDYGLLWIKGNPGTGKSSIMKFVLEDIEKHRSKDDLVVSFFFNARGDSLERSVSGLYRSLIFQLLTQLPDLQYLLDRIRLLTNEESYALEHLVRLFRNIVQAIRHQRLICLIDALDECPEEEVRQMVDNFVDLVSNLADDRELRILFSSRHYPNISINVGQQFVLEKQDGHADDLVKYIQAELKIGSTDQTEKLKKDIFDRANGIFLWIVLVVRILKREYDRGRVYNMEQRLKEIPTELNELFKDILLRDNSNLAELVLCIQWILFSKRPLRGKEFYFAMLIGNDDIDVVQVHQQNLTVRVINNFVLDCSKGLAEMTLGNQPVVQFIHESVREFLQTSSSLASLWNGFRTITRANSHKRLRDCCTRLLSSTSFDRSGLLDEATIRRRDQFVEARQTATKHFPFLEYAVSSVLYHVNEVQRAGENQLHFLQTFDMIRWWRLYIVGQKQNRWAQYLEEFPADVLDYLVSENLQHIAEGFFEIYPLSEESIRLFLDKCIGYNSLEFGKAMIRQHVQKLYFEAGDTGLFHFDILFDLLEDFCLYKSRRTSRHTFNTQLAGFSAVLQVVYCWHKEKTPDTVQQALELAAFMKRSKALKMLLDVQSGARKNVQPKDMTHLLARVFQYPGQQRVAVNKNHRTSHVVSANTDQIPFGNTQAPLDVEAKVCIEILMNRGARLEDLEYPERALLWAEIDLIHFLVEQNPPWFVQSRGFRARTPLHEAVYSKRTSLVQFLIHHGADVEAKDSDGKTPLCYYLTNKRSAPSLEYVQMLMNHGASLPSDLNLNRSMDSYFAEKIRAMKPEKPCCELGQRAISLFSLFLSRD